MSRWKPCKRKNFNKKLDKIGFQRIFSGGNHQFMTYENHRLTILSNDEYSVPQLKMMLSEFETIIERDISLDEWDS